ncbi:MAG: lactonase family protein [Rhodothermales bacterium]
MKEFALFLSLIVPIHPILAMANEPPDDHVRVYVGTYTRGASQGIYLMDLDLRSGELTSHGLVAATVNPSFLAVSPDGEFLYAVNEVSELDGAQSGGVSAFKIDSASGNLTFLNQRLSGGTGPCYLIIDKEGKHVLVANYGGGSVASFPVLDDGSLGEKSSFDQHEGSSVNPERQEGPHAHSIVLDRANRYALSADLGLDEVLAYRFDSDDGALVANDPPFVKTALGAGPRHLAFRPDGRFVYVINEMHPSVTAFRYDSENGVLAEVQNVSTLPGEAQPWYSGADIHVHPSGRFLYASNRGHDTIAVFAIDGDSGTLTPVEYQSTRGKTPRNFAIDPTGQYLLAANQGSNTIVVFRINQDTGALGPTGKIASVPLPVCLKFAR